MVMIQMDVLADYEDEIDCTTTGNWQITLNPGQYITFKLIIELNLVSGFVDAPTISIGTNSPNYDNIYTATQLTLSAVNELVIMDSNATESFAGNMYCRVVTPANATQYQIKVLSMGYYE